MNNYLVGLLSSVRVKYILHVHIVLLVCGIFVACGGGDDQSIAVNETDKNKVVTSSVRNSKITGQIIFDGPVPEMAIINMSADPVCENLSAEVPKKKQALVLGTDKTMANVLVSIKENLPNLEHEIPSEVVIFDQGGCQYNPHVVGLRVGQTIKILNPDGTLHNVHGFTKVNQEFNEAMPKFRTDLEKVFDKPESTPFAIKCDVHPWMNAWAAVYDHPYSDVTGLDGTFEINGLPAGSYVVQVWHERLGVQESTVSVAENSSAEANFVMKVPG